MPYCKPETAPNRFWEKVNKLGLNDCWFWTGAKNKTKGKEYGRMTVGYKNDRAHRISWELHNGTIPKGLYVLHHCDTPSCVNPNHLFLGTNFDNVKDRQKKNRQSKGERNGSTKLNAKKVIEIRKKYIPGVTLQKDLALEYGVSNRTISSVVRYEWWKHVP